MRARSTQRSGRSQQVLEVALVDGDVATLEHPQLGWIAGRSFASDVVHQLGELVDGRGDDVHRRYPLVAVGQAEGSEAPYLLPGAGERRVRVRGIRERDEAVGGVPDVPDARARRGKVEIDDAGELVAFEHEVVRREVVVADDLCRFRRRPMPRTTVVMSPPLRTSSFT